MELSELIPDNSEGWSIKNNFLMYKKYQNIPVLYISEDDCVYVFLDVRVYKKILKLTQHLVELGLEFYFMPPELSDPTGVDDFHELVILHYFSSYSNEKFFNGFKKIDFDLIYNLIKWTEKEKCFDLVKSNLDYIIKKVKRKKFNIYIPGFVDVYKKEIVDEFNGMYLDIQISKIL